jgi:hypothetical protein
MIMLSPFAALVFGMWDSAWSWLQSHQAVLGWLLALGVVSLVLTLVLLPIVIVKLPADYFTAAKRPPAERGVSGWLLRIGKNLLGVIFVVAGIAMLLLPGQGLLTLLIGLLLLDFPGKRAVERRLIRVPMVRNFTNSLRERHRQPPLLLD